MSTPDAPLARLLTWLLAWRADGTAVRAGNSLGEHMARYTGPAVRLPSDRHGRPAISLAGRVAAAEDDLAHGPSGTAGPLGE